VIPTCLTTYLPIYLPPIPSSGWYLPTYLFIKFHLILDASIINFSFKSSNNSGYQFTPPKKTFVHQRWVLKYPP
jgi:hypothetical protein